jgi:hypothetical protein
MTPNNEKKIAIVGDEFWLSHAATLISNATTTYGKAGEKLSSALVWYWGIYSGIVSIGTILSVDQITIPVIFVGCFSAISLIVAYSFALFIQLPTELQFDPRSPTQIKRAYLHYIKSQEIRYRWAIWAVSISLSLFILTIVLFVVAKNGFTSIEGTVKIEQRAVSNKEFAIYILGGFKEEKTINVLVFNQKGNTTFEKPFTFKAGTSFLEKITPVDKTLRQRVTVTWPEGDGVASFTTEIK